MNPNHKMKNRDAIVAALLFLLGSVLAANEWGIRPNILIITADNLGFGDLPSYNSKTTIKTPHLDRLATQGARLTNFYTASPTCTVSPSAIGVRSKETSSAALTR